MLLPSVRKGGIIGIDNMLKPQRYAEWMTSLADHVKTIPNIQSVIVPIDNGELLCVKISD